MNGCSFQQVLREIWVGFCINTWKRFFLEVLFKANRKSIGSSKKMILRIFKIALRLRDRHVFMWRSVETLNVFNALTL